MNLLGGFEGGTNIGHSACGCAWTIPALGRWDVATWFGTAGWGRPVGMATFAGVQGDLPAMNCNPPYDVGTPFGRAFIDHSLARLLAALVDDALGIFRRWRLVLRHFL